MAYTTKCLPEQSVLAQVNVGAKSMLLLHKAHRDCLLVAVLPTFLWLSHSIVGVHFGDCTKAVLCHHNCLSRRKEVGISVTVLPAALW